MHASYTGDFTGDASFLDKISPFPTERRCPLNLRFLEILPEFIWRYNNFSF
jgi:hypothetical protein